MEQIFKQFTLDMKCYTGLLNCFIVCLQETHAPMKSFVVVVSSATCLLSCWSHVAYSGQFETLTSVSY
jgi:hypothetical protein